MDRWKDIPLSKEEEEGVIAAEAEEAYVDVFNRSLVGKLWSDIQFNVRAFKSTMVQLWRLKNPVEIQDLSKNLFLFRFSSKRDVETVLRNGPWSFDRNLLLLEKLTGEEQPSGLMMNTESFWVRVYDLPLKLRSEAMAKKLGNIIGSHVETDPKDVNRLGRFLRLKATIDLRQPLKRGTVVKYQEKAMRVFFKYERLPTFCFVCGRIGHQLKDCDELGDKGEEGYEDLEENELSFGPWLRASPLPKVYDEQKKDSSSGCSKNLFGTSSSHSKCETTVKGKEAEIKVNQIKEKVSSPKKLEGVNATNQLVNHDVECVAESLGAVALSKKFDIGKTETKANTRKKRGWVRQTNSRKQKPSKEQKVLAKETGKRQLVEVQISEGNIEDVMGGEKKRRHDVEMIDSSSQKVEVVLDDQHHRVQ